MLPLSGIRIIGSETGVAGPYAGMVFGDLGAEYIKIGIPGQPAGISMNRNKKSININLQSEEGKEVMRRLLKTADIFFENYSPNAIDRLGFSYEVVSKIKPDIIYVSLKGYGDGPYGDRPAWDPCIEAQSGIMDTIRPDSDHPPNRACGPNIDKTTGMYCVLVSMIALMHRRRTGEGDYVRCNMFEDAISFQGQNLALYTLYNRLWGQIGPGIGEESCFKALDRWVSIDARRDADWKGFCDAFNVSEKEKKTFATKKARNKDPKKVNEIMANAVANKLSYAIVEKLKEVGVPCRSIETWKEVTAYELPEEAGGEDMLPLRCSYYNLDSDKVMKAPAAPGEDTEDLLKELGYTEEEITKIREKKAVSTNLDEGVVRG